MTYSCTSNGVMSKTVLNHSNIWSFHALGAYAVREIHLKKTKHYLVYVPVVSLLGIKLHHIILMTLPPSTSTPLVNNDNCREILIMRKSFHFIFLRL